MSVGALDAAERLADERQVRWLAGKIERGLHVRVAVRLNEAGVLPDPVRRKLTSVLTDDLIEQFDGTIIDGRLGWLLLTDPDIAMLKARVAEELLPMLATHAEWLQDNYSINDDDAPEEYLSAARTTLADLAELFEEDKEGQAAIDSALAALDEIQKELEEDYPGEPDFDDDWRDRGRMVEATPVDSIFSDIDE